MNLSFRIVKRTTIRSDIITMWKKEKKALTKMLASADSKLSFTTDVWTSAAAVAFVCITVHWIDQGFELRERTLDFVPIYKRHTGANGVHMSTQFIPVYLTLLTYR